jgi:phage terminase large subunit
MCYNHSMPKNTANQVKSQLPSKPGEITLPHNFQPRPYQLELLKAMDDPNIRSVLMRWCRRAGKDKSCINVVAKKMFERVGAYYYVFPQYSQARKALWEGRDKDGFKFMDHIPKELIKSVNNNEMKIETVNGSILRMIGSDNFDSVMGTNPVGIVYSEFSLQVPQARDYMSPILAQNDGWEIINGTPRGKNHMYDVEQTLSVNPRAKVLIVQTLWEDLPNYFQILSREQLQQERAKGITEEMIEQEYGVSYAAGVQGAYYADKIIDARKQNRIGNFPHNDHMYVDTFWDIGASDDTVIWFKQTDGRANIFIDYYEANNADVMHYAKVLRDKGYTYRTHYLPHDGIQRNGATLVQYKTYLAEALRQADVSDDIMIARKPAGKIDAITAVRARFSSYFFDEVKCREGLTKLALYHKKFDVFKRCFLDNPVHDWTSHAADALSTDALSAHLQDDIAGIAPDTKITTDFNPLDY